MVFSEDGGEGAFLSFASVKLSPMSGILLMVLYLCMLESELEPSRLDLRWLNGPGTQHNTTLRPSENSSVVPPSTPPHTQNTYKHKHIDT